MYCIANNCSLISFQLWESAYLNRRLIFAVKLTLNSILASYFSGARKLKYRATQEYCNHRNAELCGNESISFSGYVIVSCCCLWINGTEESERIIIKMKLFSLLTWCYMCNQNKLTCHLLWAKNWLKSSYLGYWTLNMQNTQVGWKLYAADSPYVTIDQQEMLFRFQHRELRFR